MRFLGQFYGIESFNTPSAKAVGKGMSGDKLKEGLLEIKDYFMKQNNGRYRGTISMIYGLPYETVETAMESNRWLIDNWSDQAIDTWPLELPYGEGVRDSKISVDYAGYGYRIMDISNINRDDLNEAPTDMSNWINMSVIKELDNRKYRIWENDYMNIFDAYQLHVHMEKQKMIAGSTLSTFTLSNVFYGKRNVDERLKITTLGAQIELGELFIVRDRKHPAAKLVDEYVHKKLNMPLNS